MLLLGAVIGALPSVQEFMPYANVASAFNTGGEPRLAVLTMTVGYRLSSRTEPQEQQYVGTGPEDQENAFLDERCRY